MKAKRTPSRLRSRPSLRTFLLVTACLTAPVVTRAEENAEVRRAMNGPGFVGTAGCSSSLCHGGAGEKRGQLPTWQRLDHHAKSFATLGTERSARMAQSLSLGDPRTAVRCTECHAPMAAVPTERLAAGVKPEEGISCENCHGPSSNWIRSHTRTDFSHAQNVQTGVRELSDLYARAGACIACHQTLPGDMLAAGHPPLLFELDSQTVAEPPHWTEKRGAWLGPQAWLVGQAAALREASWSLSRTADPAPGTREDWGALVWLLRKSVDAAGLSAGDLPGENTEATAANEVLRAREAGDALARAASRQGWSRATTRRCLAALAGTHGEFSAASTLASVGVQQGRARRLALALARLLAPMQTQAQVKGADTVAAWTRANAELEALFVAVDARSTFDPAVFSDRLARFEVALGAAQRADAAED